MPPARPISRRTVVRWFGLTRVFTSGMMSRRASLASHILGSGIDFGSFRGCSCEVITRKYIRDCNCLPGIAPNLLVLRACAVDPQQQKLTNPVKVPDLLPNRCH